jgi:hypothetical protein
MFPEISNLGLKLISDDDPSELNQNSLASFVAHFPAGSSFKSVKHFKQLMKHGLFEHFDYGRAENIRRYS